MEKLDLTTPNFTDENIQKLSELFPNCVTENSDGKTIDFDVLKQELSSNIIEGNKERYQLNWPGKAESLVIANTPLNKTLRPVREESKDFDNTDNLYIEGDNLEVLKLLQETYLGKVKVIYVDPPYNTGNDILYKNDFSESQFIHSEKSGEIDDEGNKATTNIETNGRYHSDWLSDIYPKIKLSRSLLADDGIFITTIDHYELCNLGSVCDEVFGYDNRLGLVTVYINPKGRQHERFFSASTEHMLVYAKNKDIAKFNKVAIDVDKKKEFIHSDDKGKYRLDQFIRARSSTIRSAKPPEFWYPIYVSNDLSVVTSEKREGYHEILPIQNGVEYTWKTIINTFNDRNNNGAYVAIEKEGNIVVCNKFYESQVFRNIWMDKKYFPEFQGTKVIKELFDGKNIFSYPKSVFAIEDILKIVSEKDSIILDYFSGSATTAHAVMKLNAEDRGNRKFIMVQIPETTDEKSEAYKAGYKTITEIGKERIRRAGEKIKEDISDEESIEDLDIGFRVLKVDDSNMKDVYFSPDNTNQADMLDLASNIKDDRNDEDLLFMVLLDWGVDLSVKIERREVEGKTVYFVDDNFLAACFEDNLDENFIRALVVLQPLKVVLRDSGFANSSVKINVEQIFKQADIEVRVI